MQLPTEIFGRVAVVHTSEELQFEQVEEFRAFIAGLARHHVVVDLDSTEALDSAGLTVLLDVRDMLRECGGDLKIASTNPVNSKILEITRVDLQIPVFESVLDAVKSFR